MHVLLRKKANEVLVEMDNTGQGIPADELSKVFTQFYRVEKSRSSTLGGSGLGLTIVKRIVELHHGRINLESEYGKWVQVQIVLPLDGSSQ